MKKAISRFFADLGYPLRNLRWSWGARNVDSILLRTWSDEFNYPMRKLVVLDQPDLHRPSESYGLDERIVHLQALWEGGMAGYTVIAEVKDKRANPRAIGDYRPEGVFALNSIEAQPDGSITAIVGEWVDASALVEHAKTHRTARGEGAFPIDDAQRSGLSTDSYSEKIPAIRTWLIEMCGTRGTVKYKDVMDRFGLTFYPLRNAMSRLGRDCKRNGEPIITALIVDKDTLRCSQGFFDEFQIVDDEMERERCYAHWARDDKATAVTSAEVNKVISVDDSATSPEDLEERAARFTQVQTRPEQGAFRDAVFRAFDGRCAVSGCMVPEALEAAHLLGRDWRQGHNRAADGVLLRRDLHNLYDRGLLMISETGEVELSGKVLAYYEEFNGVVVTLTL